MKILIFIPVYNCEKQVIRLLKRIEKVPELQNYHYVFIDNQSQDSTIDNLSRALTVSRITNARIFRNEENFGLGGSHKIAFKMAEKESYEVLVTLHGDDQANPEDLLTGVKSLIELDMDCLLGSRFKKTSKLYGYSRFRIIGNQIFNILYSMRFFRLISDMGSGLNIYRTTFLQRLNLNVLPNDLTFNNKLLIDTIRMGSRLDFFPISWQEIDQASNAKLFTQAKTIIGLLLHSYRLLDAQASTKIEMKTECVFQKQMGIVNCEF
jgi:glycosyltransferase involved in cell wall biosynthesis